MSIFRNKAILIVVILLVMAVVGRWWQGEQMKHKGATIAPMILSDSEQRYVMVQIDGAVQKPGVYQITTDAHVMDLIFLAGGLLPEARLGKTNLAKVLESGDRIHILGAVKSRKNASVKKRMRKLDGQ